MAIPLLCDVSREARPRCRWVPRTGTRRSSKRSMSESSVAVPISGTGRECGTSASRAPSEMAIVTSNVSATALDLLAEQPPPQRRLGTEHHDDVGARGVTPTRPRPSATRSSGAAGRRRRTCGRTVAKSVNASGSISARALAPQASIMVRSAIDAESPASFQPVNAATSTGRLRFGSANQRTCSVPTDHTLSATRSSVGGGE